MKITDQFWLSPKNHWLIFLQPVQWWYFSEPLIKTTSYFNQVFSHGHTAHPIYVYSASFVLKLETSQAVLLLSELGKRLPNFLFCSSSKCIFECCLLRMQCPMIPVPLHLGFICHEVNFKMDTTRDDPTTTHSHFELFQLRERDWVHWRKFYAEKLQDMESGPQF